MVGQPAARILVECIEEIFRRTEQPNCRGARTQQLEILGKEFLPELFSKANQKHCTGSGGDVTLNAEKTGQSSGRSCHCCSQVNSLPNRVEQGPTCWSLPHKRPCAQRPCHPPPAPARRHGESQGPLPGCAPSFGPRNLPASGSGRGRPSGRPRWLRSNMRRKFASVQDRI